MDEYAELQVYNIHLALFKNWYARIYVQMYYIFKMKLVQNVYGQNENIFLKYNYFER